MTSKVIFNRREQNKVLCYLSLNIKNSKDTGHELKDVENIAGLSSFNRLNIANVSNKH